MCYCNCPHENHLGECRGRPYGVCPDDPNYAAEREATEAARDEALEQKWQAQREEREEEESDK